MRVLFTATPGRGHIHPMVPLAAAFVARGHQVLWAVPESAADRLRDDGFEAVVAGPVEGVEAAEADRLFPEIGRLPPAQRPDFLFAKLFGPIRVGPMLDDLLAVARSWRPELLVCDQAELAGPIVAAALGVANLTHAFGSLLPAIRLERAAAELAPLWEAQGLEPRPFAGTYDHLYLDIYPPSLRPADAGHVPHVQPLRPVAFASGGDGGGGAWVPVEPSDPLVYVTFGTIFNRDMSVIATAVEGIRRLPIRVVVTLGPGRDPALLGPQPPNVHVASYIRQTELLPHCAAVASHAGSGTFLAALGLGLPQLLLPQAADQFLNAAAGARAGMGIALQPAELTADRVCAAMERVLGEPGFRAAAGGLAQEIEAMPAPEAVVAAIEQRYGSGL